MTRRSGFTLVELVVVILILGILAGVAAPKMFNQSRQASESALKQSLAVVRDAVELYASQNGGSFPPCTSTGTDFKTALTPFIRGPFPSCPVGATNANVAPGTAGTASPTNGWVFNTSTGAFMCGSSANSPVTGVAFDTY